MPNNRAAKQVDKAARDGRLLRVTRRKGWDQLDGSIVDRGPKWLLMAVVVDAGFDGHTLIRKGDIRRIQSAQNPQFLVRALAFEGRWPLPGMDGVDLSSTQALLESLAQIIPLVSIHYERDHPDECLIGTPHHFRRRQFCLRNVNPTAEWDTDDSVFRYREVSRIGVGGAYQRRLADVAGPPPGISWLSGAASHETSSNARPSSLSGFPAPGESRSSTRRL